MTTGIEDEEPVPPRADLIAAFVAMVFGSAVAVASWRMDRLEHLNINAYEIPGLVPFVLGVTIFGLGTVLAIRESGRAAGTANAPSAPESWKALRHMGWVFGLTLVYPLGMIGSGMPFWLATGLFVMVFIGVLDRERQEALGRAPAHYWMHALAYGVFWSALVSFFFEQVFLVRLP